VKSYKIEAYQIYLPSCHYYFYSGFYLLHRHVVRLDDYLIIHCVWRILIGCPLHDTGLTVVAFEGQSALETTKGCKLVCLRFILIVYPIAEATNACGNNIVALPAHTSKYFHFLSKIRQANVKNIIINNRLLMFNPRKFILPTNT